MADNPLRAELIVEAKQALATIQTFAKQANIEISKVGGDSSATTAKGDKLGKQFATTFISSASALLAGFSIEKIIGGLFDVNNAQREVITSNLQLTGSVKAANNAYAQQNNVLKDGNSTIEQKALALGISTEKLYKDVSATQASSNATSNLEKDIKSQTRAFEDKQRAVETQINTRQKDLEASTKSIEGLSRETKEIDKQIKSLKANTEEKVKALRTSLGGDNLDKDKESLEIQKNKLEIRRDEQKLSGDGLAARFTQLEIDKLGEKISLNANYLENIEFQTDVLEKQSEIEVKNLETKKSQIEIQKENLTLQREAIEANIKALNDTLANNKSVFDIDIEPTKRKLEDLKEFFSGSGGQSFGKVINKDLEKQINALAQERLGGENIAIDPTKLNEATDRLVSKFGKTLKTSDIQEAIANLVAGGANDVAKIEETIQRFVESSTKKAAGVTSGQALVNLSYGFRTGSSTAGNNSGISENFSDIDKIGLNLLKEKAAAQKDLNLQYRIENNLLTKEDTFDARQLGILSVTNDTIGAYDRALESGALSTDVLAISNEKLSQGFGEILAPSINSVLGYLIPFVENLTNFVKDNPETVKAITGLALALSFLLGILTAAGFLLSGLALAALVFGTTVGAIALPITLIVLAIGGLIAIGYILYDAFNKNLFGIKDTFNNVFNTVKDYVLSFKDNFAERVGEIIGFFISLPIKLLFFLGDALLKLIKAAEEFDLGSKISNLLISGLVAFVDYIASGKFREDLGNALNGIKDFFKGFINGLFAGIPGTEGIRDGLIRSLDSVKFAKGGLVKGVNTPAILNDGGGQEFVINAQATKQYLPLLEAINRRQSVSQSSQGSSSDNRQFDYSNNSSYVNYGGGNSVFSAPQNAF